MSTTAYSAIMIFIIKWNGMLSKRHIHTYLPSIYFFIISCAALYICFFRIGSSYLEDWDESWYAEITKQMLRTGEFFVSRWNGAFMFDKPPLYMWFTAFFATFFGLHEFTIRLTSVIAGAATIILTTYYAYKKWGIFPSLLAFLTIAINSLFIWRVRSGNVDSLATLLILLTFFTAIWKNHRRYSALGILFTLIFLTKASLVFFPMLAFGIHELIFIRKAMIKEWKGYLLLLSIFVVIIGGWMVIGASKVGYDFVYYFLFKSDQGVSKISFEFAKLEYVKYTFYSLQRYFFIPFILGLLFMLCDIKKREHVLLLIYSLFLLLMLSFTERNNNWYLLPSMPFWSLVIAYCTYRLLRIAGKLQHIAAIIILIPSLYIALKTYRGHITPMFYTNSTATHTQTALMINRLSRPSDIVVRLDRLYPSTIFYADRKVLTSQEGDTTHWYYISREDLNKALRDGNTYWIAGNIADVKAFAKKYNLKNKVIKVNTEEALLKVNAVALRQ